MDVRAGLSGQQECQQRPAACPVSSCAEGVLGVWGGGDAAGWLAEEELCSAAQSRSPQQAKPSTKAGWRAGTRQAER